MLPFVDIDIGVWSVCYVVPSRMSLLSWQASEICYLTWNKWAISGVAESSSQKIVEFLYAH